MSEDKRKVVIAGANPRPDSANDDQDINHGPGVGVPKYQGGNKVVTAGSHPRPDSANDDQDVNHGPGVKR